MFQKNKASASLLIVLGLVLIACQKQQEVIKPQPATAQTASKMNFALNTASTKCRISIDDAVLYTKTFREQMEKVEGKKAGEYTIAYTIPAEGLLDLFTTAEQQGKKLKAVRTYRGIKNGHETLVYVGVDENNNDLITNADYGINDFTTPKFPPVEDQGLDCPGTCLINPNILTGK